MSVRWILAIVALTAVVSFAAAPTTDPAFWSYAPTPPMGWNSYDSFGDSVTETEILANARYMKDHLLAHGWNYCVVDFRWYDAGANSGNPNDRAGARLSADEFGRLIPAVNRFPSATGKLGFGPLAARIHAMGLKFGIHIMRGIPRQTVAANLPIEGSYFHAADAANNKSICPWCADMYGVHGDTEAGRAWYDSLIRQYAQWGVDYLKVDDMSRPYSPTEIEAIRSAIDRCARPIVLSLSPGQTPISQADHVMAHANMWRISDDFWDRWKALNLQFVLLARWQGYGGPGHWPDADMIPFGHVAQRCYADGPPRVSRLTHDEQITLMSLWALAPSPLMLGMNLPENDEWTNHLITNDAVLAIDQDPLGQAGVLVGEPGMMETWKKDLADGSVAIGLFNRGHSAAAIHLDWDQAGLHGTQNIRDLWADKDLGKYSGEFVATVPSHGAILLRAWPAK